MRPVEIPRYVDSQPQFLWWELDEFAVAIALFVTGIVTEMLGVMIIMIFLTNYALRRFKNNSLDGVLHHIAFWNGMLGLNKEFKDSFQRKLTL